MLLLLIKLRLQAQLAGMLTMRKGDRSKTSKSRLKTVLFALLMLYCVGCFVVLFGMLFAYLAEPFALLGLGWFYFTFAGIIAFTLMFFGSVFTTKSQLYEARDNELLLAMPIPPGTVLASRMIVLYLMNLFFELIVLLPAGVFWWLKCTLTPLGITVFFLLLLFLPMLALALSALCGWLIALISARFRNKTFFTVLFTMLFLGFYWFGYSKINTYLNLLLQHSEEIAGKVQGFSPLYWYGSAIADANLLYLLLSCLLCAAPFLLVCIILSKTFLKTVTTKRGFAHIHYQQKDLKTSSVSGTLLRREFTRLLHCSAYIINAGLGVLFLVVGGVMLLVKQDMVQMLLTLLPEVSGMIAPIAALALSMMIGMVLFTAPSISLEGKTLWILRTLPIPTKTVLRAKLNLHIIITLPAALFAAVCLILCFELAVADSVCLLLCALLFTLWSAEIGLAFNLRHPTLDWISETQAVKSGIGVLFTMLANFVMVLIPGALYLFLLHDLISGQIFLIGYLVLLAALDWLLLRWLNTKGCRIFDSLS